MSKISRREEEHNRMKQKILGAARELFIKDGFDNVSMRKIAAKIDYSPAALYRYFKNKEDLLLTLKREGMEKFRQMQIHLPEISDPFQRLREGGLIYLNFASAEPEYYELLFNRSAPSFADPEAWIGKPHRNFMNFKDTVRQCIETGVLGDVSVDIAVASLWASVHGLACLVSTGRLQSSMPEIDMDTVFDQVLDFITIPQQERARQGMKDEN